MSDLLSENEIDALVNSPEESDEHGRIVTAEERELYDLTSGMHRIKGWAKEVKIVDERLQANLSLKLLHLLHKSVSVRRQEIIISKFGAYKSTLPVPSSINIYSLSGLVGFAGIIIDASLVHALVNAFFGGGSRQSAMAARDFTETEQRVVNMVLKNIIKTIQESWEARGSFEFVPIENDVNAEHLTIYGDADVLMIRPFTIEFSGGGGEIQLILPGTALDALFREEPTAGLKAGASMKELLASRAVHAQTSVSGQLRSPRLTISEVFNLKKGDILPIESPEKVDVKINGVTKYLAKTGSLNGKVAMKILGRQR